MMTEDEKQEIRLRELGGEAAAEKWDAAWKALHAYAHASGCPAGANVYEWFNSRTDAYTRAMQEAMTASFDRTYRAPLPGSEPGEGTER